MSIQYVSSSAIVGKVIRDFKPQNTSFEIDAIEWIAEALDIMKMSPNYVKKTAKIVIESNRVKVPCDVLQIGAIRITEIDGAEGLDAHFEEFNGDIFIEEIAGTISDITFPFYELRGSFLHFKFEKGSGKIYYYGMPLDECGYPLVPDDTLVTNALSWYILMKWLGQGNVHPVHTYDSIEAKWFRDYPRGQNSVKRITPEKMAKVARNWIQLLPRINRHEDYFTEQKYYFDTTNGLNFDITQFTAPAIIK